jgi:hypothetical protein
MVNESLVAEIDGRDGLDIRHHAVIQDHLLWRLRQNSLRPNRPSGRLQQGFTD